MVAKKQKKFLLPSLSESCLIRQEAGAKWKHGSGKSFSFVPDKFFLCTH